MITTFLHWLFTRDWIWGPEPKIHRLQDARPVLKDLLSVTQSGCGVMLVSPEDYQDLLAILKERGPVIYSGNGFLFQGFRIVPDDRVGSGRECTLKIFE